MKVHHEPESSILSLIVKEEVLRDAVSAWTGRAKFPRIRFQARVDPNDPRGADSAWSNPVGMTGIDEQHIMAGFQLVLPSVKFDTKGTTNELGTRPILADNGGNAGEISPVPSVFDVKPLSDRTRFGFSLTGPLGGGVDYGEDFVGPYSIQNVTLAGVAITPSFGCQVVHSPDQRGRAALKKQVPRRRLAELCANRPA